MIAAPGGQGSRSKRWFIIGCLSGMFLVTTQALAAGGWTGLLAVGEDSPLRPMIEAELPDLTLVPDDGHDGQIYYAIGLDLAGRVAPTLINDPQIRYQRLVYPAVASVGGLIGGYPLLWSMVAVSVVGLGLATAAIAMLATDLGAAKWVHFGTLMNPGIWLSVRQLTPDMIGIGVCLLGLAWAVRRKWVLATAALLMGSLTKEALVLFAGGLALWLLLEGRRWLAITIGGLPALAVLAWSYVAKLISGGLGRLGGGNWSAPFRGIDSAASFWPTTPTREQVMTILAIALIVLGVLSYGLSKSRLVRCLLLPWLVLPLVTSEWVWRFGSSSLRGFAPIGVLGTLGLALRKLDRSSSHEMRSLKNLPV